ncbi:hypothetical protein RTCIAT899_PC05000 (plasmid) [Rhizobium tropici CIAT 899]|nr:hypothetical protein RTCIAT899_PC05000 [Rhizobium tropici CIAT 899]
MKDIWESLASKFLPKSSPRIVAEADVERWKPQDSREPMQYFGEAASGMVLAIPREI